VAAYLSIYWLTDTPLSPLSDSSRSSHRRAHVPKASACPGCLSHAFLTPPKILWETPEVTTAAHAIYHPRHSYLTRFGVKCHSASRRFRITLWKGHQVAADTGLAVLIFPTIFPRPEKAMLSKREQDTETTVHFRSDRVSRVNGMYFFSTRENTLEGPFFSKEDAERETEAYVRRMQAGRLSQHEPPSSLLNG
jgi:hypothetical protein